MRLGNLPGREWQVVLTIIFLALGFRLLFIGFFGHPNIILDAREYEVMAENILAGRDLNTTPSDVPQFPVRVPVYGLFIAMIFGILGHSASRVIAAQTVVSAGLCALTYLIASRSLGNRRTAVIAGLLMAAHLPSWVHCGVLYPDTLFALLLGISVWGALQLVETLSWKWALGTGALVGFSTLCKAAGQGLVIVFVILLFILGKTHLRRKAGLGALLLAGFVVVMAPWIARNYVKFHAFVPTGTLAGFNFLTGNYRQLVPKENTVMAALPPDMLEKSLKMNWIDRDAYFRREGYKVFRQNISDLPRRAILKTGIIFVDYPRLSLMDNIGYNTVISPRRSKAITWAGVVQNSAYVLLALLAILLCRGARRRFVVLVVLLLLYFWAGYVLTRSLSRYSVPLYPYICILSACSLSKLFELIMKQRVKASPEECDPPTSA